MRYLVVPPAADICNPVDPQHVIVDRVSFATAVTACCTSIASKQGLDAIELVDLRDKVDAAAVGSWLALSEPEYKALSPEFQRPTALSPHYVLGGGIAHIRAVLGAVSEKPTAASEAQQDERQVNLS